MTELKEQLQLRDDLCAGLREDVFGPARESTEESTEPPLNRFLTGILYPRIDESPELVEGQVSEDAPDDDAAAGPDPAVALSNVQYPSSAGITFAVDPEIREVDVTYWAAQYRPEDPGEGESTLWRRQPIGPLVETIPVGEPVTEDHKLTDGLRLFYRVRPEFGGARSVTVVLINDLPGEPGKKDAVSYFQVELEVQGTTAADPFVARPVRVDIDDADMLSNALLYRNVPEFAVGHGCSATWDQSDGQRARNVRMTFFPTFDVEIMESSEGGSSLAFTELANLSRTDLVGELGAFVSGYEEWISDKRREAVALGADLRATADTHLSHCETAAERIRKGIDLLSTDAAALRSFQLANEVMLAQMVQAGGVREGTEPRWRPFQLAFILISMPSIANPEDSHRDFAELLWFPTGGGKTEAYLGLFAFAVFYRRITKSGAAGVTALMRYTLRLLTTQQFERASRVVCACELTRRRESDLGDEQISIGLFVGSASTPNKLDEARTALSNLRAGKHVPEKNPCQLRACPWCTHALDPKSNYSIRESPRRLLINCSNAECPFEEGLPIHVVDEDLYRVRPTLVIGTIDKFAGLPWRPKIGNLFNLDEPDLPPPDLIIQDELHLISGPLGTMAGQYETAVDLLCSENGGAPPKVVASTATIRRANAQSMGLFAREVRQFPPPGLEPRDNWFARAAAPDEVGARRYVGLMAPGASHSMLMIRTYAALLHGAAERDRGAVVDPYWTLVGYFNSLRVLGAARMQVQDDVHDALANLGGGDPKRVLDRDPIELTSRADSTDIPGYLKQLEQTCEQQEVLDVVLATNMIQVGVDIDRLGLMVVMGQPQAAAEYIQATSRVGRRHPGLVVTLLNAARSRDRSHYEGFVGFHSSMYRSVEATSVTPFSARARDRGLHAVLIALARLTIPGLRENEDASRIAEFRPAINELIAKIIDRTTLVEPENAAETEAQLLEIVDTWISVADTDSDMVYESWKGDKTALMSYATPEEEEGEDTFSTMWSLRDVDVESNLYYGKLP